MRSFRTQIHDWIENRVLRNSTRVKITTFDSRQLSSFPWRDERKKGPVSPSIFIVRSLPLYDSYTGGAMQRRRCSCIRATCNNAIVRTTGNNRTIYEPRGLALRMYDYRGKCCVAHTLWTSLWRTSWPHRHPSSLGPPRPPVITHAATVFPSHGWLWKSRCSAEGQYRRGQRSFYALSSHFR